MDVNHLARITFQFLTVPHKEKGKIRNIRKRKKKYWPEKSHVPEPRFIPLPTDGRTYFRAPANADLLEAVPTDRAVVGGPAGRWLRL